MLPRLVFFFAVVSTSIVFSAPIYSECLSDDGLVKAELKAQSEEPESMIDLKVKSNNPNRPGEVVLPTRERVSASQVAYTLLDTEAQMLIIDTATGKGKLSKGGFIGPNPNLDVMCQK